MMTVLMSKTTIPEGGLDLNVYKKTLKQHLSDIAHVSVEVNPI
jgi:hypothetical protein